jgi:hypothetical protein
MLCRYIVICRYNGRHLYFLLFKFNQNEIRFKVDEIKAVLALGRLDRVGHLVASRSNANSSLINK